jgi:hypothetical protein
MNAEKRESEEDKRSVGRVITSYLASSDLREFAFIRG